MKKITLKPLFKYCSRARLELIILFSILFVDLLSKFLISRFMELNDSVSIINNFLSFYYTLNTAAAFSFDFGLTALLGVEGVRIFFIVLMSLATIGFSIFMIRGAKNHRLYRVSFAMIIAGALGNLYDRIVHGAVRDFIRIEYFGKEIFGARYFAGIFNLADSSLVIGVGLFMVYVLFFFTKDENAKEKRKKALEQAREQDEAIQQDIGEQNE